MAHLISARPVQLKSDPTYDFALRIMKPDSLDTELKAARMRSRHKPTRRAR
jgi:hypothetical protein